jgi:hypothetical protein
MTPLITLGTLTGAATTVTSCENALASTPKFIRLKPDASSDEGLTYFRGNETQRSAHADTMSHSGRTNGEQLLTTYGPSIAPNLPILEIGPFLRPLGTSLAKNHPWLVWEYDRQAGQKIADSRDAEVFALDLNKLTEGDWESFLTENKIALGQKKAQPLNLGVAILSSVLNYIDYHVVLTHVISNIADGGLLIIANSNAGDHGMMRGKIPPNGSQILEFLLSKFPNQIELLPETKIIEQSFNGTRTKVVIAARINKKQKGKKSQVDLYAQGLEIWVNYREMPHGIGRPPSSDESYNLLQNKLKEFWYSENPIDVAQATQDISTKKYEYHLGPHPTNRIAELEHAMAENRFIRNQVLQIDAQSSEAQKLRTQLATPLYERFLPEREILLRALQMNPSERQIFMEKELKELFELLRHSG